MTRSCLTPRLPAWLAGVLLAWSSALWAIDPADLALDESPARPAPDWVRMIDQGERDPRLAGMQTPAGIQVEIAAEEPAVLNPVGMTFDESGTPYVLEWRASPDSKLISYEVTMRNGEKATVHRMIKSVRDQLKLLFDDNGDGQYERADVRVNDLEIPSGLLLHEGWLYTSSLGQVTRRRQRDDGSFGPPEEIIRGLCGFNQHQASGLVVGLDGWMTVTAGDDDNHAEGSDGSRATVLRNGAAFRMRPDGSQIAEFARGFRNPYRNVVGDHFGNIFHIDNDQEDGSKFQGVRLLHVLEGADYGWRLYPGTVCCRADFSRGAAHGERPGTMPPLLKTGRGAPAGLLIYQGTAFPTFFRGLLIYPDVVRRLVRAYAVERVGSTFAVTQQFVLMSSPDPLFRPCQAVQGPDGAIYIVDWRTDGSGAGNLWGDEKHGRIYRLIWSGTDAAPAIPRGRMDAWAALRNTNDETLWALLDSPDYELRIRAQRELVRAGPGHRDRFLAVALAVGRSGPARAAALTGAVQMYNARVQGALLQLLADEDPELRRLACESLGRNCLPHSHDAIRLLLETLARDPHPAVRRAAALAAADAIADLETTDTNRFAFTMHLRDPLASIDRQDVLLWDGVVRALERLGNLGIERLLQWAWSNDATKQELAVAAVESLRTAEGATALDRMIQGDTDELTTDQIRRLFVAYRRIQVEPPIRSTAVAVWLEEHPMAPAELKIAALETLALVPGGDADTVEKLALELLEDEDPAIRRAAVQSAAEHALNALAPVLWRGVQDQRRSLAERREIIAALTRLRSRAAAFTGVKSPPGVEQVLGQIAAAARSAETGELRADLLFLLSQVDHAQAEPIALGALDEEDETLTAAAIDVLGTRPESALALGQRFAAGKLARTHLPRIAAVLRKHADKEADPQGPFHQQVTEVFRQGLLVSLDPAEVQRIERLVASTGDPLRGLAVYLDAQRSQCAHCHKLEGVGGQVGPDLSKIWETHTVAKIMESMIDPSKEIKQGFSTWTVTTQDGQVHSGLKVLEDEQQIVLRDAQGRDLRIPQSEVEEKAANPKSLMPDGVLAQLSFQEFIDLVAFLKHRQTQESLRTLLTQAWVLGPLAGNADATAPWEAAVDPLQTVAGDDGQELSWRRGSVGADGRFDLTKLAAAPRGAYLLTFAHVPAEQTVELKITADEPVRLAVNGESVATVGGRNEPAVIQARLRGGWNALLIRTANSSGELTVGLQAQPGTPLRFSLEPK